MSEITILDGFLLGLGWMLASLIVAGLMLLIGFLVMRHYDDKEDRNGPEPK